MTKESDTGTAEATHEEICDQALEHYESLAKECSHWDSVVPKAIEFYKQHGPEKEASHRRSKEELRLELEHRVEVRRFLSPSLVLCQLHVGSVIAKKIIDHIMEFDVDVIDKAISKLMRLGYS